MPSFVNVPSHLLLVVLFCYVSAPLVLVLPHSNCMSIQASSSGLVIWHCNCIPGVSIQAFRSDLVIPQCNCISGVSIQAFSSDHVDGGTSVQPL